LTLAKAKTQGGVSGELQRVRATRIATEARAAHCSA